jgi:hypothetical protein
MVARGGTAMKDAKIGIKPSRNFLLALVLALAASPLPALASSVSNVLFSPSSPASLDFGDLVNIDFDYDISGTNERIFARPFTSGALSPAYSASPSGLYNGAGTQMGDSFTIFFSGLDVVHVDSIRFEIYNEDQSTLLATQFFDADFTFGKVVPVPAAVWLFGTALIGLVGIGKRRKPA